MDIQCYQGKEYIFHQYATLNTFFAMHHQNKQHIKKMFFRILPIETNTDAIQVQEAKFAKSHKNASRV